MSNENLVLAKSDEKCLAHFAETWSTFCPAAPISNGTVRIFYQMYTIFVPASDT